MADEKNKVSRTREFSVESGVRKDPVPGTDEGKDLPRNLEGRGLRTATPFPNIIRIEQLDGAARNRYSSGLNNVIDKLHSVAESGRIGGITNEVFYGFVKTPPDSQKIDIRWKQRGGLANIISVASATAAAPVNAVAKMVGGAAGQAVMNFTEGAQSLASSAFKVIDAGSEIAGELAGINTKMVGGNTIKRVESIGLNSFSVTCSWYLPEQYALFCKGIRSLFRIAYPNEVSLGDSLTTDVKKLLSGKMKDVDEHSSGPEIRDAATKESMESGWTNAVDTVTGGIGKAFDAVQWAATKLGLTFSIDPSPVRVSIGQSWDLEPLAITGLTIKPSRETFIEPTTHAHLPITVEVTINLDYWLTPRAGQENMSIAGQEIFGWLQEDRYKNVIKDTEKYVAEKNEKMWGLLTQDKLNSAPNANRRRGVNM